MQNRNGIGKDQHGLYHLPQAAQHVLPPASYLSLNYLNFYLPNQVFPSLHHQQLDIMLPTHNISMGTQQGFLDLPQLQLTPNSQELFAAYYQYYHSIASMSQPAIAPPLPLQPPPPPPPPPLLPSPLASDGLANSPLWDQLKLSTSWMSDGAFDAHRKHLEAQFVALMKANRHYYNQETLLHYDVRFRAWLHKESVNRQKRREMSDAVRSAADHLQPAAIHHGSALETSSIGSEISSNHSYHSDDGWNLPQQSSGPLRSPCPSNGGRYSRSSQRRHSLKSVSQSRPRPSASQGNFGPRIASMDSAAGSLPLIRRDLSSLGLPLYYDPPASIPLLQHTPSASQGCNTGGRNLIPSTVSGSLEREEPFVNRLSSSSRQPPMLQHSKGPNWIGLSILSYLAESRSPQLSSEASSAHSERAAMAFQHVANVLRCTCKD